MTKLVSIFKNESAATTVEYALLLAMIGALLLAAIVSAGGASGTTFGTNAAAIGSVLK